MKPMLQIALDTLTIEEAFKNVDKIKEYIDVVEVGTILLTSQGKIAIKEIKKRYPNKIILADGKIADAGSVFAKMFFDNGADFTTAICAAETETIAGVQKVAKSYGKDKDTQVELTSHFTYDQVKEWVKVGIEQVVYHRSRDSQASGRKWGEKDINSIKKLMGMGLKVSLAGGVSIDDIKFFKDLDIYIFIVGRSIRDAADPNAAAKNFKLEIDKYWS